MMKPLMLSRRVVSVPSLRVALHRAQDTARSAEVCMTAAARAADRGREAVEGARKALGAYTSTDAAVAAFHADRLRTEGSAPAPLPPRLIEARSQQAAAREALADAEAAAAILDAELVTARATADTALAQLRGLIDQVVQDEAAEILTRMRELENEAARMRLLLLAFAADRPISASPLSPEIQWIAQEDMHSPSVAVGKRAGYQADAEAWHRLRADLASDPDARFQHADAAFAV